MAASKGTRFNVRMVEVSGDGGWLETWEYLDFPIGKSQESYIGDEDLPGTLEEVPAQPEQLDLLAGLFGDSEPAKARYDALARRERYYTAQRYEVARLVQENYVRGRTSFVTLTIAPRADCSEEDIAWSNRQFSLFVDRLRKHVPGNWQYLACRETQRKRAERTGVQAQHYHMLVFGVGFIPAGDLREWWGLGWVKINRCLDDLEGGCSQVGWYVSKYMTKEGVEDEDEYRREKGKRRFFRSKGLKRPRVERFIESHPMDFSGIEDRVLCTKEYTIRMPDYSKTVVPGNHEERVAAICSGSAFWKTGRVRYTKIRKVDVDYDFSQPRGQQQ